MGSTPLQTIFRHLDRWRHLPAYQLERRADIFFSAYLKGMLEEFTGTELDGQIIPELPIKRDIIWIGTPATISSENPSIRNGSPGRQGGRFA